MFGVVQVMMVLLWSLFISRAFGAGVGATCSMFSKLTPWTKVDDAACGGISLLESGMAVVSIFEAGKQISSWFSCPSMSINKVHGTLKVSATDFPLSCLTEAKKQVIFQELRLANVPGTCYMIVLDHITGGKGTKHSTFQPCSSGNVNLAYDFNAADSKTTFTIIV